VVLQVCLVWIYCRRRYLSEHLQQKPCPMGRPVQRLVVAYMPATSAACRSAEFTSCCIVSYYMLEHSITFRSQSESLLEAKLKSWAHDVSLPDCRLSGQISCCAGPEQVTDSNCYRLMRTCSVYSLAEG